MPSQSSSPTAPSSKKSKQSLVKTAATKAANKARLKQREAGRPADERIISREDWNVFVYRKLSETRELHYESMKVWFTDFLTDDEDVPLHMSVEESAQFFVRDGKPITVEIVRMFLEYIAQSRQGTVPGAEGRIGRVTMTDYLDTLSAVMKRHQNPVERDVITAARAWIDGHLIPKGLVSTKRRKKQSAMSTDLTLLVYKLLSVDYMVTFDNTRDPLQLLCFMSLATDCSGRVGEFIAKDAAVRQKKFLEWSHVAIYAFRTPTGITLRALVQFQDLKSRTFDPDKHKTIPLRLLPLELAAEDSLRFLIVLGLIDGVFENIRSWSDFQKLNPGPDGTQVRLRQSALGLPVFRKVKDRVLSNDPLNYGYLRRCLINLSRALGFEMNLVCTSLRRGAAYLLAVNCSKEERCARMGHRSGDSTYWNHYRNETSTVDFQALRHSIQEEDLTQLSSISLNRRPDAPTRPSEAGYRKMYNDPTATALRDTQLGLLDQLLRMYGSVKKAAGTVECRNYEKASTSYQRCCAKVMRDIYRDELRQYFQADCPTEVDANVPDATLSVDEAVPHTNLTADDDAIGPLRDFDDFAEPPLPTGSGATPNDDLIDPMLRGDTGQRVLDFFGPSDVELPNEQLLEGPRTSSPTESGEGNSPEASIEVRDVRVAQSRSAKTIHLPITVVDTVSKLLCNQIPVASDAALADIMCLSFNHMYPPDAFYPDQEPLPGTKQCRFCNKDFSPKESFGQHSRTCQQEALLKTMLERLNQEHPPAERCSWVGTKNDTTRRCTKSRKDFKKVEQWHSHLVHHPEGAPGECRFGACGLANEPTTFGSSAALARHVLTEHNHRLSKSSNPVAQIDCMLWWCGMCFRWVSGLDEDLEQHARCHLPLISDLVHSEGYAGTSIGGMVIVQPFCPFCLHDATLPPTTRLKSWTRSGIGNHLVLHLEELRLDTTATCPASRDTMDGLTPTCTNLNPMSRVDLSKHLQQSHNLKLIGAYKRKRDAKPEDEQEEQPPAKVAKPALRRHVLQPKSINLSVVNSMKALGSGVPKGDV